MPDFPKFRKTYERDNEGMLLRIAIFNSNCRPPENRRD